MPLFGKAYSLWKVKWLFFMSVSVLLRKALCPNVSECLYLILRNQWDPCSPLPLIRRHHSYLDARLQVLGQLV